MHLKKLSLLNFKNYEEAELEFSERINCFIGPNGVGKTNLLDAIHYLALCKSYFNAIDSQNILHDKDFCIIQGVFELAGEEENIYCGIQKNKRKQFKRNKKDYPKLSDHIGLIPLVMISPSDSSLIMDGGEERRKFINGVISQFDRLYLENVLNYNRVLLQRNTYLKSAGESISHDTAMLEVYDDQLSRYGQDIFFQRQKFIKDMLPVFNRFYNYISGEKEIVSLEYKSQLEKMNLLELLKESLRKDKVLQYTTCGIHRDDLEMNLDGYPLKKVGSQGQQKTFQLALKLGKFEFIRQVSGKIPILLLDDVFDKFDNQRVEQIVRLVAENMFGQIFITDTDHERINAILDRTGIPGKIFSINERSEVKIEL